MSEATTPLASRSPQTVVLDNVLRRELRLSDPYDPDQIATALLGIYPGVKDQMDRERKGFAYADRAAEVTVVPFAGRATSTEVEQGRDDLERDLATLINSSELKDIRVELTGWGRAVRQAAVDGLAAGTMALDVNQFDRAMSARRTLGDYARLSRYVGAMSGDTQPQFRRLAQSCDVMGGLILVAMGEGLAAGGVTRGASLIRVAASELQSRRNGVINALRNLTGTVDGTLGQGAWPYGLEAYRNLFGQLEAAGQADLRTLLDEGALAQALDSLVDLAVGATGAGLRELSTSSTILVQRLTQLVRYGQAVELPLGADPGGGAPESPALAAFVSALQLFIDAFTGAGSDRLLYLARPAIVTYGLYGMGGPDPATQRLINLTMLRGQIAEQVDCFASCGCDERSVRTGVLLDLVVSRLDRAIDFYAVGADPMGRGDPEIRASAAAFIAETLLNRGDDLGQDAFGDPGDQPPQPGAISHDLWGGLNMLMPVLANGVANPADPRTQAILGQELRLQFHAEIQTERLVQALSPGCRIRGVFDSAHREWGQGGPIHTHSIARDALYLTLAQWGLTPELPAPVAVPQTLESSFNALLNRGMYVNGPNF